MGTNFVFTHQIPLSVFVSDGNSLGDASDYLRTFVREKFSEPLDFRAFYCMQVEQAPTTGRYHIQGCLRMSKVTRTKKVREHLESHVENMKGSLAQAVEYCSKHGEGGRVSSPGLEFHVIGGEEWRGVGQGKRSDIADAADAMKGAGKFHEKVKLVAMEHPTAFVKYHRGFEALARQQVEVYKSPPIVDFRPWQTEVKEFIDWQLSLEDGDDRSILWVYGARGGEGKSHFVRYLVDHYEAVKLQGRLEDAKHGYNAQPIIVFDIARTQVDTCKHLYTLAEELKNGLIYKTKYESCPLRFRSPVVAFWANFEAPKDAWSEDRLVEVHLVRAPCGDIVAKWHYGYSSVPKTHTDHSAPPAAMFFPPPAHAPEIVLEGVHVEGVVEDEVPVFDFSQALLDMDGEITVAEDSADVVFK